ncbi:MAG TPA: hypothetical protein VFA50_05860 [Stellaceae bacterium]|nr:hypothetical protein [Stellaceae bacterium]
MRATICGVLLGLALLPIASSSAPLAASEPALGSLHGAAAPARCAEAPGSVQKLAVIVNTRDNNFNCLGVTVDATAAIRNIRFESHEFRTDPATHRPVSTGVHVKEFPLEVIASPYGAVLDGQPGHDAVILRGRIPAGAAQAALDVRYLYNGITGEFRSCRVNLDRDGDAVWHLVNARDEHVSRILVKTWALPLVGTAGIETLEGVCEG